MDYNLIIKPDAEKDIDEALEWYKSQGEKLPLQLLDSLHTVFSKIQNHPEHYQKRYKNTRVIFTKKFPYAVYFTLENETVFIHAVLHNKQNPENVGKRN
ncbi:type II toxin-antitoxin system RelE/ParE family toxin [Chryseobacterium sp. POE27]|jgi:toxin ParE1/3/4|uniref:type II toxin-antitoxin system RelE/ParE family toxin n=1 Tax=Chryseobacterium sp. POE27 TaxID=3138177 RepID=UPI00321A3747